MFANWFLDFTRKNSPSFSNSICHVTSYTRELPINMDRMYENAIDWEHLPWLHSTTFCDVTMIESGDWGWKIKAYLTPKSTWSAMTLELRLDRTKNRWITKTLSGLGKGSEVWTHAIPIDKNKIKIIVDFYVPKLPSFLKSKYAETYEALYAQLYDEDLWMMSGRQTALNLQQEPKKGELIDSLTLGTKEDISKKIPMLFVFNNQEYRLISLDGEFIAHTTICPHMLGPLNEAKINEGILECPWHGYQFDIKTRKCISGQRCRMAPAPFIHIDPVSNEVFAKKSNKTEG